MVEYIKLETLRKRLDVGDDQAKQGEFVDQSVSDITLKKYVGLEKEKRFIVEYNDLDHLFGCWSKDEHLEIQGKIDSGRQIDEELWR